MSPADSASPAWLTVPPADGLPEQVAGGIGPVANKIGFVPNVARLLAISPDHFIGWWRCFDELMGGPSGLSKTQREMIAVVVSAEALCPYCVAAHAAALRLRTKDPVLVDRLAVNYRHVELGRPGQVMLGLAVKLTHTPRRARKATSPGCGVPGSPMPASCTSWRSPRSSATTCGSSASPGFPNAGYHGLGRTADEED